MSKFGALVYGIYPRSENFRKNINLWERSRLSRKELEGRLGDEKKKIGELLSFPGMAFTDPLSNWHDILRPPAISLTGVTLGELRRYKETNTFYRQPVIEDYPSLSVTPQIDEEKDFPYFPLYHESSGARSVSFLPGPYSFMNMSSVNDSLDSHRLLTALSKCFAELLEQYRAGSTVIFDTIPYRNTDLKHLSEITERFETTLVTSGSLKGAKIDAIKDSVAGISGRNGLDSLSSFGGNVYLQYIDSQNTRLEDVEDILRQLDRDRRNLKVNITGITHTEYLDFLPRSIADRKISIMKEVTEHD